MFLRLYVNEKLVVMHNTIPYTQTHPPLTCSGGIKMDSHWFKWDLAGGEP